MAIQKFSVSNDPDFYEAWPDLVLADNEKLICVFAQRIFHTDKSYSCIMLTESYDRGRTWTKKHPLTEETAGETCYNCPRITRLSDGTLAITVDYAHLAEDVQKVLIYYSRDNGETWSEPEETPLRGVVPDKLIELDTGRFIISAHDFHEPFVQKMHYSDDRGKTWSKPIVVATDPILKLCEVSMLPCGNGEIVAFLRENSIRGYDCKKVVSHDNGETWSGLLDFPLPGCHRPTAGFLRDGSVLITYRFMHGGCGGFGFFMQNFFAALTDRDSALTENPDRNGAWARILPIDFDRSPKADIGYSGWVQFEDGEIYMVTYLLDDAPKAQIRGYSLRKEDFILSV